MTHTTADTNSRAASGPNKHGKNKSFCPARLAQKAILNLAESGLMPDSLIRRGIRQRLARKLRQESEAWRNGNRDRLSEFMSELQRSPVAVGQDAANVQHYEAPPEYFRMVLGPRLKYSCCVWEDMADNNGPHPKDMAVEPGNLASAEDAALAQVLERSETQDGMTILDLGCGWGSFSLYALEQLPNARVTSVSNSSLQREYILQQATAGGYADRLTVITADMASFDVEHRFDRIVSLEMFEHMRNWERLLARTTSWLKPDGLFFMHVFCHQEMAWLFDHSNENEWMARHFFTGGMMPSADLAQQFPQSAQSVAVWQVNGRHYSRTLEAWLQRHDAQRAQIMNLFAAHYGRKEATRMFHRWRLFYLACSELFAYNQGKEWHIFHGTFRQPASSQLPNTDTGQNLAEKAS